MNNFHFRSLYFTNRACGYKITCDQNEILWIQLNQLSSNQEEADTKVFLATKFAENVGCSDITIFTVDSNIEILAVFYVRKINCRLMVRIGVGSNMRILDIGTSKWSDGVLESLPALRAISGWDSVSAGKGKAKWLSTVQKKEEYLQSVSQLGDTIRINADVFQKIEKLFCHLYGMPDETNINETRYRKFCMENMPEPHQLPPTKDELTQDIIRANYQTYVWKRALETNLDIPSPIAHGWKRKDEQICCEDGKTASCRISAQTYYLHMP